MPHMRLKHNRNLKSFLALLVLAPPAAQAEIAAHDVPGYTFTLDAAYAAHQENGVGSLKPGKWADEIDDIQVIETWVAGKRAYDSEQRTTQ